MSFYSKFWSENIRNLNYTWSVIRALGSNSVISTENLPQMATENPEAALIAAGLEHINTKPLLISTGLLTAFGGIFVLARLYIRAFVIKAVKWDDCKL